MTTACSSQPIPDDQDFIDHLPAPPVDNDENPPQKNYQSDEGSSLLPPNNEHLKDSNSLKTQSLGQKRKPSFNFYNLKYLLALLCMLLPLGYYLCASTMAMLNHEDSLSNISSSSLIRTIKNLNLGENFKRSRETFDGSTCEEIYSQVLVFLDIVPVSDRKHVFEVLDSYEDEIERSCPASLEGINPDIYYKMGEMYSIYKMDAKYLKWLSKVEEVLPSDWSRSFFGIIFIKTYVSLAKWNIGIGNDKLSKSNLEKAETLLKLFPAGNTDEYIKIQSWWMENLGNYYLAKYRQSQDVSEKEDLYQRLEKSYKEAMEDHPSKNQRLYAGVAQCSLAEFYIHTKDYEKAEGLNRRGKKNIQLFYDQEKRNLHVEEKCLLNEALINTLRGQYTSAKAN